METHGGDRRRLQGITGGASAQDVRRRANRFESHASNGDGALARGEIAEGATDGFGRFAADNRGDGVPTPREIAGGMGQRG
jgi:hypothetical protein